MTKSSRIKKIKQYPDSQPFTHKALYLAPAVRLCREFSGGLAFHREKGDILELDKGAFTLLTLLARKRSTEDELRVYLQENNLIRRNDNPLPGVIQSLAVQTPGFTGTLVPGKACRRTITAFA